MDKILCFFSTYSSLMAAIATIVIAIFSVLTWLVSKRIHQSTQKRDAEITNILKKLIAATLASAPSAGYEKTMAKSFKEQLKALDELEKE